MFQENALEKESITFNHHYPINNMRQCMSKCLTLKVERKLVILNDHAKYQTIKTIFYF